MLLLLIPAIPSWEGDPERDAIVNLSVPVSIVLLVVYVGARGTRCAATPRCTSRATRRSRAGRSGCARRPRRRHGRTALVAEILVGSLETFSQEAGLSEFFVAAVIVAIVGNAAEHGGAVVVAYRGKIKLAAEIALSSAAQVAVFLIPAVTLLSWLIDPLALAFRAVEIGVLAAALVDHGRCCSGRATRAAGAALSSSSPTSAPRPRSSSPATAPSGKRPQRLRRRPKVSRRASG